MYSPETKNMYQTMDIKHLNQIFSNIDENIFDLTRNDSIYISALFIYPVKGCKGFGVKRWPVSKSGLYLDRHWVIYSTGTEKYYNIVNQSDTLIINSYVDIKNKLLILASPNMENNFILPILDNQNNSENDKNLISIKMIGKKTGNIFLDCGDEVANWINKCLNKDDCRLLRQIHLRKGDLSLTASHLLFTNTNSIKYVSENIIEDHPYFNTSLMELCWIFRSNVLINGLKEYEETKWKNVSINGLDLKVDELCERCNAINIDLERLDYDKILLRYLLKTGNGKAYFGILMTICGSIDGKYLSVGDELLIK